jgi:hypothetical protein
MGLRSEAVHPRTVSKEGVPHPAVPTNVAHEVVTFTCEGATQALDFLVRIFEAVLLLDPKTGADLVWGEPAKHAVALVKSARPVVDDGT